MSRLGKALAITTIASLVLAVLPLVQASPAQAAGPTWTKYAGNVTLEYEEYVISSWVIYDGSTYRMWYTHLINNIELTEYITEVKKEYNYGIYTYLTEQDSDDLLDYLAGMDPDDVHEILDFFGNTYIAIGYATSTNGVTWSIVEDEALTGGNQLWNSVGSPCVIKDGSTYKMWYTQCDTDLDRAAFDDILSRFDDGETARKNAMLDLLDSIGTSVGYAESASGKDWIVVNPEVLTGGGTVLSSVGTPSVIKNDSTPLYEMWYTQGVNELSEDDLVDYMSQEEFDIDTLMYNIRRGTTVIGYATSEDGVDWNVVDNRAWTGGDQLWNSVGTPTVVKNGSSYEMWYTRIKTDLNEDTLEEVRNEQYDLHLANFTIGISPGNITEYINDLATKDYTRLRGLLSDTASVIGYATSSDGENWAVADTESLVGVSSNLWSSIGAPCVIKEGSSYEMWYTRGLPDFTVSDLLELLTGDVLPIGYAYYIPTPLPPPPAPGVGGGGGGGGGGGDLILDVEMGDEESYYFISATGRIKETVDVTSEDKEININIQKGTIALDENEGPLISLKLNIDDTPPPPPADAEILGLPYNFEPDGATFNPLITVTWSYDPSDVPGGVAEEDLRIACYDEDIGEWVVIPAVVDPLSNTITAHIGHFTTFAIIAYTAPPPPLPLPAIFTVGSLIVSPPEVSTGETVSISILATNTGESSGSYILMLEINGETEATEEIILSAGAHKTVTFTTVRDEAGTYLIDINGITGSFAVAEEPPPPPPEPPPAPPAKPSRWLIIGIIGAVAAAIAIPLTRKWRERRY